MYSFTRYNIKHNDSGDYNHAIVASVLESTGYRLFGGREIERGQRRKERAKHHRLAPCDKRITRWGFNPYPCGGITPF